jgi:cytochrome c553
MAGGKIGVSFAWLLSAAVSLSAFAGDFEIGRDIYVNGRLPSGQPLQGKRLGNERVGGAAAACITCHRRSGMGSVEGEVLVEPITGTALFSDSVRVIATMDPRRGKSFNRPHPPYSEESFARAVREGVHVTGREMHPLMPRYKLSDDEIRGLMAYLSKLSTVWSPGVTADTINFATVIAPGVSPEKKAALVEMTRAMVRIKNSSTRPGRRYMTTPAEMMLKSGRHWNIHVWELQGAPDTWNEQLARFYRETPVFALVSGLSEGPWVPVDAFCQRESIPCLFPSVDLPPDADGAEYPVYFSRGVLLEAEVLADYLKAQPSRNRRLVQIHAGDVAGSDAAFRVESQLRNSGLSVETRVLAGTSKSQLAAVLGDVKKDDLLMMWLHAPMVKALKDSAVPPAERIFFSGRLVDGEAGNVPAAWRDNARLIYPYELPEKRRANVAYLNAWLSLAKIDLVSEPLQSEIFFALNFVTDTVSEMLNNLYRDYLMERTVNMVAFREGSKAEQELRDRSVLGRSTLRGTNAVGSSRPESKELLSLGQAEKGIGDQGGTTVYPRLSLGVGQNFASKGAYIVRFSERGSDAIVSETDWIIP